MSKKKMTADCLDLSVQIISKARELLVHKYQYIVKEPAIVRHEEWPGGTMLLSSVSFVSDGDYQDKIVVTRSGILLVLEEGDEHILATYDGWDEFLNHIQFSDIASVVVLRD